MVSANKDNSRLYFTSMGISVRALSFLINDTVVLDSNYGLSIFSGFVLIFEFLLQSCHLIQGTRTNNPYFSSITVSSVEGLGICRNNDALLCSHLEFDICAE